MGADRRVRRRRRLPGVHRLAYSRLTLRAAAAVGCTHRGGAGHTTLPVKSLLTLVQVFRLLRAPSTSTLGPVGTSHTGQELSTMKFIHLAARFTQLGLAVILVVVEGAIFKIGVV